MCCTCVHGGCRCGSCGRTEFLYHCTDQHLAFPCSSSISLLLVIRYVFVGLADVPSLCVIVLTHVSRYRVARRSHCLSRLATCLSLSGCPAIDAGLLVSISLTRPAGHAGVQHAIQPGRCDLCFSFYSWSFFLAWPLLDMLCSVCRGSAAKEETHETRHTRPHCRAAKSLTTARKGSMSDRRL